MLTPRPASGASTSADTFLMDRERLALRWTASARVLAMLVGIGIALVYAGRIRERVAVCALLAVTIGLQALALALLRRSPPGLRTAGWLGGATDALIIVALPVIWYLTFSPADAPLVHLGRHNYTAISVGLVALNVLSMRPAYPAFVGTVGVIAHVVLAWIAIHDPRVVDRGALVAAMGVGAGTTDLLVITPLLLAMGTTLLTLAARGARRTLLEAVALEQTRHRMREEQLQSVLDARLAAAGELVAGVEHEINNPLGAIRSSTDTATRATVRLRETILSAQGGDDGRRLERTFGALEQSLSLAEQAGTRLSEVMETLAGFVKVDSAERAHVDLAATIRNALAMVSPGLRPDTELVTELDDAVTVEGDPRRLSEALLTVVRNAAEAFDTAGTLRVSLTQWEGNAVLEVVDTGRGMAPDRVASLFNVDFGSSTRIHARFGLPLCRSILHRHGGDISVQSQPGEGTTIRIRLPLAQPAPSAA